MNVVLGEETVDEPPIASPTVRRSPRKHSSSSKAVSSPSPRPVRSKKTVFANCAVAEDDPSDSEEQIADGFLPSDKECGDSKKTPDSNVVPVRLSQVDINMLSSSSGGGQEKCSLLCYDEALQQIPAFLASSWSMKFFPLETEVPSTSTHSITHLEIWLS